MKRSTKTSTMAAERGLATSSFVNLPDDIYLEIAKIIDLRLCSNPSSRHARDPEITDYTYRHSRPSRTLARLTLVCKQLHRIYAPFSTWRSLHIEAKSHRSERLEPSTSLARLLKYPEIGFHARELVIRYRGSHMKGFIHAFARGNLVDFDRFLVNTPRLETVRLIDEPGMPDETKGFVHFPIQFFTLLSSLASLRYLHLSRFIMGSEVSLSSIPPLHQVRIFRYSLGSEPATFGDLLRFSMPSIQALYINDYADDEEIDYALDGIQVCRHFPRLPFMKSLTRLLSGILQSNATSLRENLLELYFSPAVYTDGLQRISDSLRGENLRGFSSLGVRYEYEEIYEARALFNKADFPCLEVLNIPDPDYPDPDSWEPCLEEQEDWD
jgi:hypothetical protein